MPSRSASQQVNTTQDGGLSRPGGDDFDTETANQIRELEQKKQEAVREENFDLAKQLKLTITRLTQVSQQLAQLESQKKAAIQNEDFDQAKQLKLQIAQLRQSAYSGAAASTPQGMPQAMGQVGQEPQMLMGGQGMPPNPMAMQPPGGNPYGYPGEQQPPGQNFGPPAGDPYGQMGQQFEQMDLSGARPEQQEE